MKKIKGENKMWSENTSGAMLYGKEEQTQETEKSYKKNNLNETKQNKNTTKRRK